MNISFSNDYKATNKYAQALNFIKIAFPCEYQRFESSFSDPQPIMTFEKVLQNTID